ncbi:phospholipase D-like domain-containing protein [Azospira inquinata]|uniref:Phosphatidylserine/phosphatidylglycerophosphate/ cardiolipin synthase family protein n=1 Tax=Azospira inquinata TaxID=2785627 RepID=A0A975XUK5_9RHOO|nr:phospholipase D-like domain-containing protein [Azospira inquinata]QWT45790.1 phosphatidylserine/phosphatidylglycerophosphate/cardiolipin synthase family protein [Azospira inquinata]QWT48888.1 phosphatidylserine/phosphatidylglycerophosphate/cardiolipin synthase family protein [Azospira inquinata]
MSKINVPLSLNNTSSATLTPQWFLNKSEYTPKNGAFHLLVNGKDAFRDIHEAIARAKKSVSIVCWGFQPSMYFIRDGNEATPCIGELLEQVGQRGVKIRIISYAVNPAGLGINITGMIPGEANLPGRHASAIKDQPSNMSDNQYKYNQQWFFRYDRYQTLNDYNKKSEIKGINPTPKTGNIIFVSRGFSNSDRERLKEKRYDDKDLSNETKLKLAAGPSHHQKSVVIDYEDPHHCVGYVMGHNMLDEYWDDSPHGYKRYTSNTGRNGHLPRQDFSARITGELVGDLFDNFAQAWKDETGESLPPPRFKDYPYALRDNYIKGQFLRTQSQKKAVEDIKKCYLQALTMASQYVYVENQYFRWPPFAETLKACAAKQAQMKRDPGKHGPIYLFAITNADENEGLGAGKVNTYRMLESLGRADVLPNVAKAEREDQAKRALGDANTEVRSARSSLHGLDVEASQLAGLPNTAQDLTQRYDKANAQVRAAEAKQKEKARELATIQDKNYKVTAIDRPGLKCHICTLVAPNTPQGHPWVPVYVHAKLMLIDDAFMTLGSANLNTRSMQVDSELNIAHHRPEITTPTRKHLWGLHTKSKSGEEALGLKGMAEAYKNWDYVINRNKEQQGFGHSPIASLVEFYAGTKDRSNGD